MNNAECEMRNSEYTTREAAPSRGAASGRWGDATEWLAEFVLELADLQAE